MVRYSYATRWVALWGPRGQILGGQTGRPILVPADPSSNFCSSPPSQQQAAGETNPAAINASIGRGRSTGTGDTLHGHLLAVPCDMSHRLLLAGRQAGLLSNSNVATCIGQPTAGPVKPWVKVHRLQGLRTQTYPNLLCRQSKGHVRSVLCHRHNNVAGPFMLFSA